MYQFRVSHSLLIITFILGLSILFTGCSVSDPHEDIKQADAAWKRGETALAGWYYEQALHQLEKEHPSSTGTMQVRVLLRLGLIHFQKKEFSSAEESYQKAMNLCDQYCRGPLLSIKGVVYQNYADFLIRRGQNRDYANADKLLSKAMNFEKTFYNNEQGNRPDGTILHFGSLLRLAKLRMAQGRYLEAEVLFRENISFVEKYLNDNPMFLECVLSDYVIVLTKLNKKSEARAVMLRAEKVKQISELEWEKQAEFFRGLI